MVVAFYSPMHGQTGTSSNLLSIALLLALKYQKKLFLMESHFEKNALESMLVKMPKPRELSVYEDFGIDLLTRSKVLINLAEEQLINASFSFLNNQIHLLPGTRQIDRDIFEQSIHQTILDVIEIADLHHDMVLIDVNASKNRLSNQILERADLIVVNLSQNPWLIKQFFKESQNEKEKIIYLLGNYDKNSHFNLRNLSYEFPMLSGKNTATILYDGSWRDAMFDANTIAFMRKKINSEGKKKKGPFLDGIEKACHLILRGEGEKSV